MVTKEQKNQAILLASEEVLSENDDEEYMIGMPFKMVDTKQFNYAPSKADSESNKMMFDKK